MKLVPFLLFFVATISVAQTHRDTLYFDPSSRNYMVKYYVTEEDTMVTAVFEPATKVNPTVKAAIKRLSKSDTLFYLYSIKNQDDSEQRLQDFELEYQVDFIDSTLNRWELHNIRTPVFESNKIMHVNALRFYWTGGLGLAPGISAEGFKLLCRGLPGIVNAYFQGNASEFSAPFGGPGYEINQKLVALRLFPANRVIRKTIGPILPPNPFVAIAFLDTLISYKQQAIMLGWLGNKKDHKEDGEKDDGELKKLDKRLAEARTALVKGDSSKAREELEEFVEKVEEIYKESVKTEEKKKEREIVMTSEAYALLKYNAEYLVSKLPKKKK